VGTLYKDSKPHIILSSKWLGFHNITIDTYTSGEDTAQEEAAQTLGEEAEDSMKTRHETPLLFFFHLHLHFFFVFLCFILPPHRRHIEDTGAVEAGAYKTICQHMTQGHLGHNNHATNSISFKLQQQQRELHRQNKIYRPLCFDLNLLLLRYF